MTKRTKVEKKVKEGYSRMSNAQYLRMQKELQWEAEKPGMDMRKNPEFDQIVAESEQQCAEFGKAFSRARRDMQFLRDVTACVKAKL